VRIRYDRLIPADLGRDFDAVFDECDATGFRGINITYPYKERVITKLEIADPTVQAIAACNTVVFNGGRPHGDNTDYTGFIDAFRHAFGRARPGAVTMAGAGGVGRAVAFALATLGASKLRLFDRDHHKAEMLAASITAAFATISVDIAGSIEDAASGADGLVNCTPLGMAGHPGTAIPKRVIGSQRWAFDAVYTPVETRFLLDARAAGLDVISGYELFFHQGVNAFKIFTGHDVDQAALRRALNAEATQRAGA
jgi:shikimate dehydrogenase